MDVLYLHQYFNTSNMAGGTRSFEMAKRLVRKGHHVEMITSDRTAKGDGWYTTEEAGFPVHWYPVEYSNELSYRDRIKAFLKFAFFASVKSREFEPDVVFATSTPLTIGIPGIFASKVKDVPLVFEVRDLWPEMPIAAGVLENPLLIRGAEWFENYVYSNSERVVALSPGMKEGVVDSGYPTEKVRVIPNSCDLDLFNPPPSAGRNIRDRHTWLGERPLVTYIGAFGYLNNVSYLVRVAQQMQKINPRVAFLAIGGGAKKEHVRILAKEYGVLGENFFLMDRIPKKEVPAWLSAADVGTSLFRPIPEMEKNSANKFFDTLASGTPVAINYGGWQAELIKRTGAGLVLDSDDHRSAAERLFSLLKDETELNRAGKCARRLAEERFSRDMLADKLEDVLLEAVDGKEDGRT